MRGISDRDTLVSESKGLGEWGGLAGIGENETSESAPEAREYNGECDGISLGHRRGPPPRRWR